MAQQPTGLDGLRGITAEDLAKAAYGNRKALTVRVPKEMPKTVRHDTYKGRGITITTTYDIRIDRRRVAGEIMVGHSGHVHYHGLPTYSFMSAVDLVRQLVDQFPEDYPPPGEKPRRIPRKRTPAKRAKSARRKKSAPRKKSTKARKPAKRKKASMPKKSATRKRATLKTTRKSRG